MKHHWKRETVKKTLADEASSPQPFIAGIPANKATKLVTATSLFQVGRYRSVTTSPLRLDGPATQQTLVRPDLLVASEEDGIEALLQGTSDEPNDVKHALRHAAYDEDSDVNAENVPQEPNETEDLATKGLASGISRSKIGEVHNDGVIASDTTHHIAVIVDTGIFSRNLRLSGLTDFDILRLKVGIKRPKKRTKIPKGLPAFSSTRKHTFKDREEFLISKLVERHPEFADNLAQELPLKSAKSHGKPVWSGLQGLVSAARAQLHSLNLKISSAADLGSSDGFKASDEKNIASVATHSSRKEMYLRPSVTCQGRKHLFNAGFTFHNKPVYDSDGDSVLSVSDNLFLIATESSQSSVKFQEAVDEFFIILIRDTRIRALSPKAIRIMDAEEVERNLVRLLWLYASDLRSEARSTFEEAASRLVRRYSASLALSVTRPFDQIEGCSAEVQEPEKGIFPSGMNMINLPDGEDSGNSGGEEVDQFSKVRSFMVDRSPFLKLRNNFQDFVNTTSALSLPSPTSGVRHWTTTGSIQRIPGVHQLAEVFLLREPSSNLGFDVVNEAVFFCTFSSVPKQLSTPLVYFINLFRDYTASGDAAASARLAERPRLDSPEGVFQHLANQFWRHNGTAKGLPNAKLAPLSYLRHKNSGKQASPEMTASDPFYSLNVFFSNIAFSEMNFLNKMQRGSESDLIDSSIVETTSIISLVSRKKVVHLHMKMLQQNLHLLKSRAGFGWTQDSEAGDWSQADAMTQRLQLDFEYLLLRTKYLSGQCDHDLNSIMRSAMIEESRKAISQTSSTVRNLRSGDPGRPRRSTRANFTGMSGGESKWDGSYSHQAQVVHQADGADKSNCGESSTSKGASGQPEALSVYQKNAKRLLTMARISVLPPIIHSYMAHCRFISFGCLTPDTSQLDIEENDALYHCPASLIRKSACVYRILAPFQRWTSMSLRSSFQSGGAWLLGFGEYITRSIIQRPSLSFVKRQAIGAVLVGLWKHSALTEKLGLSEPSLDNGMKRVRWTCRCGQRLHDDFIELREGAALEMEHSLNQAMRTRPHRNEQASGQPSNLGTRAMSSLKGFFGQITSWTSSNGLSNDGLPQHNVLLQGQAPKLVTPHFQSEGRWLLVCAKIGRYATKLSQMDVCATTSDKDLFTELRKAYIEFRSKWTRPLNLRGIKSIRFVQFELHRKELVDIRKEPDMPSGERRKEYLYEACELLPPLGENYMMHLFHHPEDGDDEFLTCLRVPKKRHEKLKVCQQRGIVVGWGLHLVEGWLLNRVWILVLVLFVLGSLLFGICWSSVKHDIQGAFGVSSWILALATIVIGTVQAQLD